jgi:4-hydroxy-tetrahydrodipicolinate reductase
MTPPLRVVQWTTGNVGVRAARAVTRHPGMKLVGCFAWSDEKVGHDVGEIIGIDPIGVAATDDVDALLALAPDCVSYNPLWPDVGEMSAILRARVNIASTAGFITGRGLGEEATAELDAAARAGGVSLFGTGINPGFANLFALLSTGICDRVDRVTVLESVDATGYASAETQLSVGFAHDPDDPATLAKTDRASIVFGDAVALMGDALGLELDEIGFEVEYARATQDMDLGFMTIPEGTVAGVDACRYGAVAGRRVVECRVRWKMGAHMEPDWPLRHGYFVEVEGEPVVRSQLQILPGPDWDEPGFMGLGMIMTAMPAVNAIPAVCAARPGVVTYRDLPLVTAAGFAAPNT